MHAFYDTLHLAVAIESVSLMIAVEVILVEESSLAESSFLGSSVVEYDYSVDLVGSALTRLGSVGASFFERAGL